MWLIPPSQAQPDGYTLDQVFAKMDEVQKRFRSAAADIERTHVTVLVNDKDVSSGKFYYAREASISGHQDKVDMFMALGFGQSSQDLKDNFDVRLAGEEALSGKKTSVLELRPKNSAMFKSVQMWMDEQRWVAVQIKTTENSGDYMVLRFSNIKLNVNIPDSIFDLKMPKDVRVIKM